MNQSPTTSPNRVPSSTPNLASTIAKLTLFVGLVVVANYACQWILNELNLELRPSTEPMLHRIVMLATAIYICLMALPFVPGIEIGLTMMVLFGAKIVPLVYLATVVALILGFSIGRLVPQGTILEILEFLRLRRARALVMQLGPLDSKQRLALLLRKCSGRLIPFLLRHRFVVLALALNTPGNGLIGGAGGISFAVGFCRLFTLVEFAIVVSLAVLPFPFLVWLTDAW